MSTTNIGQESEAFVAEPIETPQTEEQKIESPEPDSDKVAVPVRAAKDVEEAVPA